MALEDEYSVEIPAEELQELTTVGAVMDYLKIKALKNKWIESKILWPNAV
mgnify:CR=1 FL=1